MDMPRKRRTVAAQAAQMGPLPEMPAELIEQLVQGPMSPAEVQDLFLSFKKAVIERAMNAEMNHHLGSGGTRDGKKGGQTIQPNRSLENLLAYRSGELESRVSRASCDRTKEESLSF